MFSNLIFLIITLLVVNLAPQHETWLLSPIQSFTTSVLVYFGLLVLIVLQNRLLTKFKAIRKTFTLKIVQLELISYFLFFYFFLGGQRAFLVLPHTLTALFTLSLYFGALFIFFYTVSQSSKKHTVNDLLLIVPFALPFILFSLLIDLSDLSPKTSITEIAFQSGDDLSGFIVLFVVTLIFLGSLMILLPPLIQKIWKCKPLENKELNNRLESLCKRANFKVRAMHTWTAMNQLLTAGIMGVVPKFRYIMFSKRLLNELKPDEIEAILAHEIGHSQRKHLWLYPIIIFGMILSVSLFLLFVQETVDQFFGLIDLLYPSNAWNFLYPLFVFIPYALIITLYFRYVFGFFSRQFERQADLHVFKLGLEPEHLIHALDYVGCATGNSHYVPNWHHYSINERMQFLKQAILNPKLIGIHNKRVKAYLASYLVLMLSILFLLFAPYFPNTSLFKQTTNMTASVSNKISDTFNAPLRHRLAKKYVETYNLEVNNATLVKAFEEGFKPFSAAFIPGVADYYAALRLFQEKEYQNAAFLVMETWKQFPPDMATRKALDFFYTLTIEIALHVDKKTGKKLIETYNKAIQKWKWNNLTNGMKKKKIQSSKNSALF